MVYRHRVIAVLIQATGLDRDPPCDRCRRENGPWDKCVVPVTPQGVQATKGACANCTFSNVASKCSLRTCHVFFGVSFANNLLDPLRQARANAPVVIESLRQPPSESLEACWPGFTTWEKEIASLGKPGLSARTALVGRASPVDLMARYKEIQSRSEATRAAISNLTAEVHFMGQEMSEVLLLLSFHRVFDPERVTPNTQSAAHTTDLAEGSNPADPVEPLLHYCDANG